MFEKIQNALIQIKTNRPLVLNITNDVTMDFIANGLLALGASPVMSSSEQEMEDLLKLAQVLVINLGTLNTSFVALCDKACSIANRLGKPVVFDPVGAGATSYRTENSLNFLEKHSIAILRGNASEIMALSGQLQSTKGVDSTIETQSAVESAQQLSVRYGLTVAVSGEVDLVVRQDQVRHFNRGSSFMPGITGTGCLLSGVIGAFHTIEKDALEAASFASVFYGVCGEAAAEKAKGPGSFKVAFLDALYAMPEQERYESDPLS